MGFVRRMITKDRHLSVCICGHSTLVIYYLIPIKLHIWITLIKLLWALSDRQNGHQNGRQVSNLVICRPISSKFHIWTTFIKLLFMSEYGFCPMNSNLELSPNSWISPFHSRALCGALCLSPTVLVYFFVR